MPKLLSASRNMSFDVFSHFPSINLNQLLRTKNVIEKRRESENYMSLGFPLFSMTLLVLRNRSHFLLADNNFGNWFVYHRYTNQFEYGTKAPTFRATVASLRRGPRLTKPRAMWVRRATQRAESPRAPKNTVAPERGLAC